VDEEAFDASQRKKHHNKSLREILAARSSSSSGGGSSGSSSDGGGGGGEYVALQQAVLGELDSVGRAAGLRGFELVKAVHLVGTPWTPDEADAVMTPTLKLQRGKAKQRYGTELASLFLEAKGRGRGGSSAVTAQSRL